MRLHDRSWTLARERANQCPALDLEKYISRTREVEGATYRINMNDDGTLEVVAVCTSSGTRDPVKVANLKLQLLILSDERLG